VLEARIALEKGIDPAAVGAAVSTELCGHWEHAGPCRWPHNSAIDATLDPARFRTVFVASDADEPVVRRRIEDALRRSDDWRLVTLGSRPVAAGELGLADRLRDGPRLTP